MDVLFLLIPVIALTHQELADLDAEAEIHHQIRRGKPQQSVFKVKQPAEILVPLCLRELAALMHRVGSRIAVGDQDAAILIKGAPVLFHAGIAVDGIEAGGRIGVHVSRLGSEGAGEIHFDQRGRIAVIIGKGNFTDPFPILLKSSGKALCLGRLAAAVESFYDNQSALHALIR